LAPQISRNRQNGVSKDIGYDKLGSSKMEITKLFPKSQAENHLSSHGTDLLCAISCEEIGALLSELAYHAEAGCIYANVGDERGLRYAVNSVVNLAVRAGDEALQLRRLRSEAIAAGAERLSAIRQSEAGQ
jgi:hypothetical protein